MPHAADLNVTEQLLRGPEQITQLLCTPSFSSVMWRQLSLSGRTAASSRTSVWEGSTVGASVSCCRVTSRHQYRLQNNTLCCLPVTLSENGDVVSLGPQLGVSKARHPGTGWAESLSGTQGPLPSSIGGWRNPLPSSVGTEVLFSCWLSGWGGALSSQLCGLLPGQHTHNVAVCLFQSQQECLLLL